MIVCGGGPSLLDDLKQCPDLPKIACNHHAHIIGLECEYTIYTHKDIVEPLIQYAKTERVWVKNHKDKRVQMFGYAGTAAVIFAIEWLNAEKVYIAGCDLYTGNKKYCHEYDGRNGNEVKSFRNHRIWWWKLFDYLGDVSKLHPVSGPLIQLCEQWSAVAPDPLYKTSKGFRMNVLQSL